MKVYVIKSKQTKEYQTVVMDFIPDIRQLMEKTELADNTK